jgi:hypothetical protein
MLGGYATNGTQVKPEGNSIIKSQRKGNIGRPQLR